MCLAMAIYFEAGNQSLLGKLAVGNVITNRVASAKYPKTVCEVVKQPHQFSFYSDGKPETLPEPSQKVAYKAWLESYYTASAVLSEGSNGWHIGDVTEGALHYHATYVKPMWAKRGRDKKLGSHVFYVEID